MLIKPLISSVKLALKSKVASPLETSTLSLDNSTKDLSTPTETKIKTFREKIKDLEKLPYK